MSKTESAHISAIWTNSANNGGSVELGMLTSICNFAEQSASNIQDRLKYVHVNCGFHNKRKLSKVLFEEGISFEGTFMTRIISGDVQYAS